MSEITSLPIAKISRRTDARPRAEDALDALCESIRLVGLINPIRVRQTGDDYEVIAGSHRLQACDLLGWPDIDCIIVQDDDLHAELAMIDENLCRAELSPSDRAKQTARRKAIYLELHPETAHGNPGVSRQVGDIRERASAKPFTAETAKVTGSSERSVQRDAERGEKVIDAAIEVIRGTALDTGSYLDKIKKLSPSEQVHAAKRDLAWHRSQELEKAKGGVAGRYKKATPPAAPPSTSAFEQFTYLVDDIESLTVSDLILSAGRKRAVLGQRASGLADRMGEIMEALDK